MIRRVGDFGTETEVIAGTKDQGSIEGRALAPVHLGSEFVVTLIIQLCCLWEQKQSILTLI